jgi:site-specific DNA-cytosine methylase
MLENVRLKKEFIQIISDKLGVESIVLNSARVSAQNRERHYWMNWEVPPLVEKNIALSDIIECPNVSVGKHSYQDGKELVFLKESQFGSPPPWSGNGGTIRCGAVRGRYIVKGEKATEQRLEIRKDDKSNTLTTVQKDNNIVYEIYETTYYRRLTVRECERLQTVPTGHTRAVSDTKACRMIGNAWTVDVVSHIFKQLIN